MNGRLLRCRCASGAHVPTSYAPLRCSRCLATPLQRSNRRKSPKGASDSLLRHLQGTVGAISIRANGASRFLNRLPRTRA
jgi:hypothetical protein